MRSFDSDLDPAAWTGIQAGTLRSRYRGRGFGKNPFDIALYTQLIERTRPATVIEIGVCEGGSAMWFADALRARGIDPTVVGVDVSQVEPIDDPAVTVLVGDALDLGKVLTPELLDGLPRPWLVVEDSAHLYETTTAVLAFFARRMEPGEYLVVEDGIVGGWGPGYEVYQDGPNRAVRDFLDRPGVVFAVDTQLCDFFGRNVTYNPNGWLVRK